MSKFMNIVLWLALIAGTLLSVANYEYGIYLNTLVIAMVLLLSDEKR